MASFSHHRHTRRITASSRVALSIALGLLCAFAVRWSRTCAITVFSSPVAGRRAAVVAGSAVAVVQIAPGSARAELVPILENALRRNAKLLQLSADELVYDVRPSIVQGNWSSVDGLFKGDGAKAYDEFVQPVKFIVDGSEDFLPGLENSVANLEAALIELKAQVQKRDKEIALKAWEDLTKLINDVMKVANTLIADEPSLRNVPRFVLVPADGSQYQRTKSQYYVERCRRQAPSAIGVGDSLGDMCVIIADQQMKQ